ncbi:MAG: hypothetical protein HY914_12020 [Desulfomonile tiedjei]|nr:hypothetical protein [Desulfomonile tiedjei]
MLRRIPATLVVCLAFLVTTILAGTAYAADPNESLEILLKPNKQGAATPAAVQKPKARYAQRYTAELPPPLMPCPPGVPCGQPPFPVGISKVKAPACFPAMPAGFGGPPCILATPRAGQWELGAQAFFATIRGSVAWPRYNWLYSGYYYGDQDRGANFVDHLQLPRHDVLVQLTALYQFRPNWGFRYSVLFKEFNGGGQSNDYFWFGNPYSGFGLFNPFQPLSSKWLHGYHRVGLVYDALRSCSAKVSVFADWFHMEDQISVNCTYCGNYTQVFSKSADGALVGLEFKRCLKTMCNGGTLSCETKAGVMFLDNVEGWDVEVGARYSIPMNAMGRWGYLKGGYRLVDFKKYQNDYGLRHALEGGFAEFGFIF